jgi:hypothetical protein
MMHHGQAALCPIFVFGDVWILVGKDSIDTLSWQYPPRVSKHPFQGEEFPRFPENCCYKCFFIAIAMCFLFWSG